jgi:hypothetical protein
MGLTRRQWGNGIDQAAVGGGHRQRRPMSIAPEAVFSADEMRMLGASAKACESGVIGRRRRARVAARRAIDGTFYW